MNSDFDHTIAHAKKAIQALDGARIFITGGTGFFGSALIPALCRAIDLGRMNLKMVCLSRDPEPFLKRFPELKNHPALRFHMGAVEDFIDPTESFSHLLHMATPANSVRQPVDPEALEKMIRFGSQNVIRFALKKGIKRALLTSSGAVYGDHLPLQVAEDYPTALPEKDSRHAYARGKKSMEESAIQASEKYPDFEPVIARCFAFVGPHLPLSGGFAVGNFLKNALEGQKIQIAGDGTPLRSYLHSADLAAWILTLLTHGKSREIYNVGSDEAHSIQEVAEAVASLRSPPLDVLTAKTPEKNRKTEAYVPSIKKASRLGLRVYIPFQQAIFRSFRVMQSL